MSFNDGSLVFKCVKCRKNYETKFDADLAKMTHFENTYDYCDRDLNSFCLLLQKGVYLYEYMDSWQKFNETSFPNKEFHSNLTEAEICEADKKHTKSVWENFRIQKCIS